MQRSKKAAKNYSGRLRQAANLRIANSARGRLEKWFLAVFEGMERREPVALRAESLGCDSLGWSAQRAAPGPPTYRTPSPERALPPTPSRVTALQALERVCLNLTWACGRGLASAQAVTGRAFSPHSARDLTVAATRNTLVDRLSTGCESGLSSPGRSVRPLFQDGRRARVPAAIHRCEGERFRGFLARP